MDGESVNAVILASIALRLVGVGYSGLLLFRSDDRRFGFLTVMLALMATRQVLSAQSTTTPLEELPGLVVSVLAVLTVYYLSSYVDEERRITERLEGFRKAVEHAGHAIFLTDTDGTIEYANPAVESVTGYEPAEVVGENPRLWKSGEHDEAFYAEMWEAITSGTVWDGEIINRRKSGSLCWVDMTIAPVTDEEGTVDRPGHRRGGDGRSPRSPTRRGRSSGTSPSRRT
ncbi:MAG: PAS domain-containing protein [Haloferacaceae archaeon]